ncbi:ankyrin repeat-containing domain protein [Globomyces pollinis-pini]|nr:ankyrin repeat-containing domain protein [Globomyces pollinis-pini]
MADSVTETGENVELDTVKSSFPLSDLEKLPQGLIYQITEYLNLTDFLQFIQVSKSLSKNSFTLRQLEVLFQNNSIFKKPELIRKYLKLIPFSFKIFYNVLIRSIGRNYISIVEMLLSDSRVDPSASNNEAIRYAAHNGHLQVNCAIRHAAENGHLKVVELLVADSRVDPSANNNCAIQLAAQNGHLGIVKMLLAYSRVDPSANDKYALRLAVTNGHLEVVKILLADSKVDPSGCNGDAMRKASERGYTEVLNLLLQDSRMH